MTTKILIIEDEEHAAERLARITKESNPDYEIVGFTDSVESSIKWLNSNPSPDLIFMDIQLADGLCFEIFNKINLQIPVIFTTAYDEYAIKSFEINSIDYLLKPIDIIKLENSLLKFKKIREYYGKDESDIYQILQEVFSSYGTNKGIYKNRFMVHKGDSLIPVISDEIAYFLADEKLVFIFTKDNQKHAISFSLDQLEKQLDPAKFFRINRESIVNIRNIHKVHNFFNYKLKIELNIPSEAELIISRKRVQNFRQWMEN